MIIAGWADGYRNNSFRTDGALRADGVPHRLLAGPWAHAGTGNRRARAPGSTRCREMVAWWDRWLRGIDNGVDDGRSTTDRAATVLRPLVHPPAPDLDELAPGPGSARSGRVPRVDRSGRGRSSRGRPYPVRADVGVAAWIDCAGHLPWGQSRRPARSTTPRPLTWEWDADELHAARPSAWCGCG